MSIYKYVNMSDDEKSPARSKAFQALNEKRPTRAHRRALRRRSATRRTR